MKKRESISCPVCSANLRDDVELIRAVKHMRNSIFYEIMPTVCHGLNNTVHRLSSYIDLIDEIDIENPDKIDKEQEAFRARTVEKLRKSAEELKIQTSNLRQLLKSKTDTLFPIFDIKEHLNVFLTNFGIQRAYDFSALLDSKNKIYLACYLDICLIAINFALMATKTDRNPEFDICFVIKDSTLLTTLRITHFDEKLNFDEIICSWLALQAAAKLADGKIAQKAIPYSTEIFWSVPLHTGE